MPQHIVAITCAIDHHVDFVKKHLTQELITLATEEINNGTSLSFDFEGTQAVVIFDGKPLKDVKSVWFRKPWNSLPPLKVSQGFQYYAEDATRQHCNDLNFMFDKAFWVSRYGAIRRASVKSLQLEMAAALGFRVPATLATSSKKEAFAFLKKHPTTIVKRISDASPQVDGKGFFFPATRIKQNKPMNLEGLHLAPAIFQEEVPVIGDVRVTVVGTKAFSAIIRDKGLEGHPDIRDWRVDYGGHTNAFASYRLPKEIEAQCIALVKRFGLQFGAIDLVLDKKNKLWFIEINPNGQWGFIERDTGLPIGKAIAELLEKAGRV